MGIYINPSNETKESFLLREATPIISLKKFEEVEEGKIQVCLVDNGFFTAAGVLYSQCEIEAFSNSGDSRPREYFVIETAKLANVIPLEDLKFVLDK